MVNYDKFRVQAKENFFRETKDIQRVVVGAYYLGVFVELASATPSYIPKDKGYNVSFDVEALGDSSRSLFFFTIRYVLPEGHFSDFDTLIALYQYPYSTSSHFLPSIVFSGGGPQDVARTAKNLFYHPTSSEGLWHYDFLSDSVLAGPPRLVYNYEGGDHIAADSDYVFVDRGHRSIARYDIDSSKVTKRVFFSTSTFIMGLEVSGGKLYALLQNLGLFVYDTDLNRVDSIPAPGLAPGYYLGAEGGILHSVDYRTSPHKILRFELATRTSLSPLMAPAKDNEGIKFHGGFMYYCDFYRKWIMRVPTSDLKIASVSPAASISEKITRTEIRDKE